MLTALAVLAFCVLYTAAIAAQTKSQTPGVSTDRTKGEVHRFGFGKRVKVKIQNGTKMRGRITALSNDEFVITDSDTGAMTKVAYADVTEIRRQREMPGALKGAFRAFGVTAAFVGSLGVVMLTFLDGIN